MSTVRVLVVDDHPVVRGGVVGWLAAQPDIDVVGEAGDGLEALALVSTSTTLRTSSIITSPALGGRRRAPGSCPRA